MECPGSGQTERGGRRGSTRDRSGWVGRKGLDFKGFEGYSGGVRHLLPSDHGRMARPLPCLCAMERILQDLRLAAGLLVAYTLTESLGSLLFGVSPHDPATFTAVVVVLAGSALAATALPARRAARIDPAVALEEE